MSVRRLRTKRAGLPVFQDDLARQAAIRAHDAAARMRRRSAHVEIVDWRAVIRPSRDGTQEEKLFERKLALKNISLREAKFSLEIERRQHLPADDDVFNVRRVLGNGVDHVVAEGFALLVPSAGSQFVRRVLHKAGKDVLPWRGNARV